MVTIKTPMRLVGSYFDPAKVESLLGGSKLALIDFGAFFDAFSDNALDLAKWTVTDSGGKINEQNGRLEINGNGAWATNGIVSTAVTRGQNWFAEFKLTLNSATPQLVIGFHSTNTLHNYVNYTPSRGDIYFNTLQVWRITNGEGVSTGAVVQQGVEYTIRLWYGYSDSAGTEVFSITIKGGAFSGWTNLSTRCINVTEGTLYFHINQNTNQATPNYVRDLRIGDGWDSSSPPVYSVFDSGSAASVWDMSTFTDRGDNLNGETGSVKYKYFMSDTLYDPTNAGDRATIIAGLNASWLTQAQMQGEADQTGRYRYLAEQLISDGTQDCSEAEAADLIDVVLPAAAGGGGAYVF